MVAERAATTEVARGLVVVILSPVQAGKAEVPLEQHCPLPGAATLIITTADCGDPTTSCFCCLGHPASMGPATPASIKTATISPLLRTPKQNPQTSYPIKQERKESKNFPSCRKLPSEFRSTTTTTSIAAAAETPQQNNQTSASPSSAPRQPQQRQNKATKRVQEEGDDEEQERRRKSRNTSSLWQ